MAPYLPYPRRSYAQQPAVRPRKAVAAQLLRGSAPDLQTQFEALLDAVWEAEADWRFNDRLDMALNAGGSEVPQRGGRA
jgi:hypothetical protein